MLISKKRLERIIRNNVMIAEEKHKQEFNYILKILENLYSFKILSDDERASKESAELRKRKFDDYFSHEFTGLMRELQRKKMYG